MPKIDPKAIESAYNELGAEAMMLKQVNLDLVPSPYEAKAKTWNLTRDIIRSSGHPKLPLSRQLTTRRMSLRIDKTGRRELLPLRLNTQSQSPAGAVLESVTVRLTGQLQEILRLN